MHILLSFANKFCTIINKSQGCLSMLTKAIVLHMEMVSQSEYRSPPPNEGFVGLI